MKKKAIVNYINVFLFLLPALALFIGILIAPIIKSLYYSFYNWNGMETTLYRQGKVMFFPLSDKATCIKYATEILERYQ